MLHTVLATQNVTAAARQLNMSQPAVSRALSRLRVVFGDPLFVKGAKGVIATPRAEALSSRVALLLAELEAAIETPTFDPVTSTRVFKIATTDYGALAVLAPMIGRLVVEAPGIGIDIVPLTATSFQELGSGELDIALYSDDPAPGPLFGQNIFEEFYISLVREGHPALPTKPGGRMSMKSFLAHAHILVNIGGGRTGVVDAALAASGRSRRVAVTLPYFSTAALIVAQTDLVLTLPMRVADRFVRPHGLIGLQPPVELDGFGYRLLWHPRNDVDPGGIWIWARISELAVKI